MVVVGMDRLEAHAYSRRTRECVVLSPCDLVRFLVSFSIVGLVYNLNYGIGGIV
jgi:hypothetical protein